MRVHPAARATVPRLSAFDAYEAIAAEYDRHSRGDEWMRHALHRHYLRVFEPGQRVLDVGCGTGTDAIALARRGIRVLGVDGAPGMIGALRAKVGAAGLERLIEGRVLSIGELNHLDERFDGIISAFASLSTVDLAHFAVDAERLLRPGGRMVLHLLNAFSLWEWLGLLAQRRWRAATRLHTQSTRVFSIGGQNVPHRLYFARAAYARFFASGFVLRGAYSLGALRPPHTVRRLPGRLVHALEWVDVRAGGLPGLVNAGRFFVLDLERRA